MTQNSILQFEGRPVRMVVNDGEPWWIAKDVCDVLGIKNAADALAKTLDDDEKGVDTIYTLGGSQQVAVVNEAGLYSLVLRSRKPEAKTFKRWITHEVLPSLRRTGQYTANQVPDTATSAILELVDAIKMTLGKVDSLEARVARLETEPRTQRTRSTVRALPQAAETYLEPPDGVERCRLVASKLRGALGCGWSDVWNSAYTEYNVRMRTRVKEMAEKRGYGSVIRYIDAHGSISALEAILREQLERALSNDW